jgi:hypothetical protein
MISAGGSKCNSRESTGASDGAREAGKEGGSNMYGAISQRSFQLSRSAASSYLAAQLPANEEDGKGN